MQSSEIPGFQQITTQSAQSSLQNINKPTTININVPDIDLTEDVPLWTKIVSSASKTLLLTTPIIVKYSRELIRKNGLKKQINTLESQINKTIRKDTSVEKQILEDANKMTDAIVRGNEYLKQLETIPLDTTKYEQQVKSFVKQTQLDFANKYKLPDADIEVYKDALNSGEGGKGLPKLLRIPKKQLQWYEKRLSALLDELAKKLKIYGGHGEMPIEKILPEDQPQTINIFYTADDGRNILKLFESDAISLDRDLKIFDMQDEEKMNKLLLNLEKKYKDSYIQPLIDSISNKDTRIVQDIKDLYYKDATNIDDLTQIFNKYGLDEEQYTSIIDDIRQNLNNVNELQKIYKNLIENVQQQQEMYIKDLNFNKLNKLLPENQYQLQQLEQYYNDPLKYISELPIPEIQNEIEQLQQNILDNSNKIWKELIQRKNLDNQDNLRAISALINDQDIISDINQILKEQDDFIESIKNSMNEKYGKKINIDEIFNGDPKDIIKKIKSTLLKDDLEKEFVDLIENPDIQEYIKTKGQYFMFDKRLENIKDKQLERYNSDNGDKFIKYQLPNLTKKYQFDFVNGTKDELDQYIKIMKQKKYFNQLAETKQIKYEIRDKQEQELRRIYDIVQNEIKPNLLDVMEVAELSPEYKQQIRQKINKGVLPQLYPYLQAANTNSYLELINKIKFNNNPLWKNELLTFSYFTNPEYTMPVIKDKQQILTKIQEFIGNTVDSILANGEKLLNELIERDFHGVKNNLTEIAKNEVQTLAKYYNETNIFYPQESELFNDIKNGPIHYYNIVNDDFLKRYSIFQPQQPYRNAKDIMKDYEKLIKQGNFQQGIITMATKEQQLLDDVKQRLNQAYRQGDMDTIKQILRQYQDKLNIPENIKQQLRNDDGFYVVNNVDLQNIINKIEEYWIKMQRSIDTATQNIVDINMRKRPTYEELQQVQELNTQQKLNTMEQTKGQVPVETESEQKARQYDPISTQQQRDNSGKFLINLLSDDELRNTVPFGYQWKELSKAKDNEYVLPKDYNGSGSRINQELEQLINKYKQEILPMTKSQDIGELIGRFRNERNNILSREAEYIKNQGYVPKNIDGLKINDLLDTQEDLTQLYQNYIKRYENGQTRDKSTIINKYTKGIKNTSRKEKKNKIQAFEKYINDVLNSNISKKSIEQYNNLYKELYGDQRNIPRRDVQNPIHDLEDMDIQYWYENFAKKPGNYTTRQRLDKYNNGLDKVRQQQNAINQQRLPQWDDNRTVLELLPESKYTKGNNYIRDKIIQVRGYYDENKSLLQNYKDLSLEQKYQVIRDGIPENIDEKFKEFVIYKNRDKGYRNQAIEIYKQMIEEREQARKRKQQQDKQKRNKNKK